MKNKKIIILLILLAFSITIVVYAEEVYKYNSDEVSYDNSKSSLTKDNVQEALDELYNKCERKETTCPDGYTCTNKTNIICKRATTLHTETCTYTSGSNYCYGDGYSSTGAMGTNVIIYGNENVVEGELHVGDAFDCKVSTTGDYTERFYYISDYYDTNKKRFNDEYAVLVYYNNTSGGVASNNTSYAYYSSSQNWHGPQTLISQLPTNSQWDNISLYKIKRQILTQNNADKTSGGTLPTGFDYSGYSARLLTYQELYSGCYDYNVNLSNTKGLSTNCKFLMENTKYSNSSLRTSGGWLETPLWSDRSYVLGVNASGRKVNTTNYANDTSNIGVRPAIEILKSNISY